MDETKPHILVTGSKGLIGSSLIIALNKLGLNTKGIDNRASDPNEVGNICNDSDILPKLENCIGVVHLAAISRVAIAHKNPELCMATNYEASKNIALNAKKSGVKWFIYASSREVYGHVKKPYIDESHSLNPVNVYGRAKLKAEEYIDNLHSTDFNSAIVRFSNVFGSKNDHNTRVIPAFISAAFNNQTLNLEGSKNAFDFTFVDDVVNAVIRMCEQLSNKHTLKPMHITTGKATSLKELADLATKTFSSESPLIERPARDFDVSSFSGNPQLAYEQLGWTHGTKSLEDYLKLYAQRCGYESKIHPAESI